MDSRDRLASIGVLTGKDAEAFVERMQTAKPLPKEEVAKLKANCRAILQKSNL